MKHTLCLALIALLACACSNDASSDTLDNAATVDTKTLDADRPNVLLISIDTLRPDHLSSYGYERNTAPFLADLAREGVVFENSYAPSSSTVPSHGTMFTGRLPFQHGALDFKFKLDDAETTLAELALEEGYATFAVASSVRFVKSSGFAQGFETYENHDRMPKVERSEAVSTSAIARFREAFDDGQRVFGFVHYLGPHEPYAPPDEDRTLWHPGLSSPVPEATTRYLQLHNQPGQDIPDETLVYLRALYDGEIRHVDREVRRLIEEVRRVAGDNTLVIITSDHGDEFKEHGGLSHSRHLHEELVRVPLIMHWPKTLAPRRVARPGHLADLMPTIAEVLETEIPPGVSGRSLVSELLGGTSPNPGGLSVIVGQQPSRWSIAASLADGGRYKYMVDDRFGIKELYRIDGDDPFGTVELGSAFADKREELAALAAAFAFDRQLEEGTASDAVNDEEIRARLEAMGYLDETR